ncbi:MAG: NTP transferase domain-containing protein [Muribaculaceae bacterium]|nr:NTP transferase domain-containing protein [Muribaculaceae bacterium]
MNFAIIAAGEGSRLQQEGVATPKPLVSLNGRPMIGRLIDIFVNCGAECISVIVNEQMTEVREYLENLATTLPVELRLVVKSTPSSMHSFYEVSSILPEGRFILTTVDTIFHEDDFRHYVEAFEQEDASVDGLMAVTSYIDDEKPLYVDVDSTMRITAFNDTPSANAKYISGGIYGLDRSAIGVLQKCIDGGVSRMRNFQRALVADGLNIRAFDMGKIIDVDHQSDIAKASELINR